MALVPSPQWLDTGDNAWQLAAATFVGLQSVPGLAVLYGGIVKKKWAINSAFMAISQPEHWREEPPGREAAPGCQKLGKASDQRRDPEKRSFRSFRRP